MASMVKYISKVYSDADKYLLGKLGNQQTYLVIKNGGWIGWKLVYWGWTITIANWTITLNMITKKGVKKQFLNEIHTLFIENRSKITKIVFF